MMNHDHSDYEFDELDQIDALATTPANKRITVRYRRHDLNTSITVRSLWFSAQEIAVKLVDISSKGAAIICDKKLKLKARLVLSVQFPDQKSFSVNAVVVHCGNAPRYGLKFDRSQNDLAEHLLETQTDLEFG